MASFENEMQNAYIGDVWWRLSTDFTQYTSLAQIQAQGWTGITSVSSTAPQYSYGSSGIGVTSTGTSQYGGIYMELPTAVTNKNIVKMKYTGSIPSVGSGIWMTLCSTNKPDLGTNNQTEMTYGYTVKSSAVDQGITINKNVNGTKTWGVWRDYWTVQGITGECEDEVILDLPNSIAKWKIKSPSGMVHTSTGSISSAGLECIIGTKYFIVWGVDYNSGVTTYIKSASIEVI